MVEIIFRKSGVNRVMKYYIDLNKEFEQLAKYVKEGKLRVESISYEPHLQPRYLTDDLKETERKNKLEYSEFNITIKEIK